MCFTSLFFFFFTNPIFNIFLKLLIFFLVQLEIIFKKINFFLIIINLLENHLSRHYLVSYK